METDIINRAKAAITAAFPLAIKYKVIHFGSADIPGAMRLCPDATRGIFLEYERIHTFYTPIAKFDAVINSPHAPVEDLTIKYFKCLENMFGQLESICMLPVPIREAVSEYLVSIIINPGSIYSYFYNDKLVESARRRILYS